MYSFKSHAERFLSNNKGETIMGCLLELFFEIFFEGIFELIVYCYIKLMTLIVPDKRITDHAKRIIKNTVTTVAAILGIVLVIGLIFLIQDDPFIKNIGKYMTYIPLAIIALQAALGIITKAMIYFKRK